MGFDHSMNASVDFKPNVTIDMVINALEPIATYNNWTREDIINENLKGDDEFTFEEVSGQVTSIDLYTCGEVCYSYKSLVEQFAENLKEIAQPGRIEFRDHDTGDLENAISDIWFGAEPELGAAIQAYEWSNAVHQLCAAGISIDTINAMGALAGLPKLDKHGRKVGKSDRAMIPRFSLAYQGKNPEAFTADARCTGDAGVYEEVAISIFNAGNDCVADVLVGLDATGKPRVLITHEGKGDGDKAIAVYPLKHKTEAVDISTTF